MRISWDVFQSYSDLPPPHPTSCPLLLHFFKKPIESDQCFPNATGCWSTPRSLVNLPGITSVRKTGFLIPSICQLPVDLSWSGASCLPLPEVQILSLINLFYKCYPRYFPHSTRHSLSNPHRTKNQCFNYGPVLLQSTPGPFCLGLPCLVLLS